ncbi:hypothetical protein IEO21_07544 [Rhodonia placenta]|uniref:Secreted protein n=1 Tax=Rhodonia placenta TaxID=104341 RepID=A0A8H7U036_9APHY|nr:hypothetical protein IEO21_07544 [Postia placenta]
MWSLLLLRQLFLVLLLLLLGQQQRLHQTRSDVVSLHACLAKAHRILGKKTFVKEVVYNWAVGATEKQMASMRRNDSAMFTVTKVVDGSDNDRVCIGSHMTLTRLDMITYSNTTLKMNISGRNMRRRCNRGRDNSARRTRIVV